VNIYCKGKTLPDGTRSQIENVHGRRTRIIPFWLKDERGEALLGHTISINQPQPDTLRVVGTLQRKSQGTMTLSRVDTSFEWVPRYQTDAQFTQWLYEHLLLKGRRPGYFHLIDETVYFCADGEGSDKARNLVIYGDLPSKLDQSPRAIKTEIRLHGGPTIENVMNCKYADELIDANPHRKFHRVCRLTSFDLQGMKRKVIRDTVSNERARHARGIRDEGNGLVAQYRATLPQHCEDHWTHVQLQFVQRVKDVYGCEMKAVDHDVLNIAQTLTWGAKAHTVIDNKEQLISNTSCSPRISRPRVRLHTHTHGETDELDRTNET
jgi:hypothetical protein